MKKVRLIQAFDAEISDNGIIVCNLNLGGEEKTIDVSEGASPEEILRKAGYIIIPE